MTRNHRLLLTVALSTAIALPATPALAQSDSGTSSPGGSADSLGRDLVVHSSQNPTSSGSSIDATLSSLRAIGSSQVPLSDPLLSSNEGYPLPTDPTITQARIVAKEVEADNLQVNPGEDRVQRWTVASPSMQRHVSVEIMKPADPAAPAPMLYLLDGVDAPKLSGWIGIGGAQKVLGDENVTVVVPTQAPGSWYSDWNKPDPALGVNMWETFLTTELAPLLEADSELNFNGHRGIGGLSMGASGAVHLANANPELFDAAIGISGCYSPTSTIGRQITSIVTESRGGDVDNMWGEFGSEAWVAHDTVRNPEGLRDMAVYLSAANGTVTDQDLPSYGGDPFFNLAAGSGLERGVLTCTEDLERAMVDRGMTHQVINYKGDGVHNWRNFNEELAPAWETIRPALY